jgi:copper chaperone NosL
MRVAHWLLLAGLLSVTSACGEPTPDRPAPAEVTAETVGHYCGMLLAEHVGPKGQAHVKSRAEPYWFSSARDALIFMRQPEEPRDIAAVYVTDMATATSWDKPEPGNWVAVPEAWFVIDSDRRGGMGGPEAVPFSREERARAFASEHGGRVVRFAEVPDAYLFGEAAPALDTGSHAGH